MDQLGHQQLNLGWICRDFILTSFVLLNKPKTLRPWSLNFYWALIWYRIFLKFLLFWNRIPDPGWSTTQYVVENDPELLSLPLLIPGCWGYRHELQITVCGWLENEAKASTMLNKYSTNWTTYLGPHFQIFHSNMFSRIFIFPDSENFPIVLFF